MLLNYILRSLLTFVFNFNTRCMRGTYKLVQLNSVRTVYSVQYTLNVLNVTQGDIASVVNSDPSVC